VLISPVAMVSPSGFRRRARLQPGELGRLAMPTLLLWGERDPLGGVAVARTLAGLIPHAQLEILPIGHGPWLGQPGPTATAMLEFMATGPGR
jgi:pimeloyl-ACP methyl ester carboxylesterase